MKNTPLVTCRIQWIDENGKPTPDTRPAVVMIRSTGKSLQRYLYESQGRIVEAQPSEWFPCCAEHLARAEHDGLFVSGEWEQGAQP